MTLRVMKLDEKTMKVNDRMDEMKTKNDSLCCYTEVREVKKNARQGCSVTGEGSRESNYQESEEEMPGEVEIQWVNSLWYFRPRNCIVLSNTDPYLSCWGSVLSRFY